MSNNNGHDRDKNKMNLGLTEDQVKIEKALVAKFTGIAGNTGMENLINHGVMIHYLSEEKCRVILYDEQPMVAVQGPWTHKAVKEFKSHSLDQALRDACRAKVEWELKQLNKAINKVNEINKRNGVG